MEPLDQTPLHALHVALGAKMVPFAGYAMPVQYQTGVLAEHLHTRSDASLFDVSHMGQFRLWGSNSVAAIEALVPGDIRILAPGGLRYTMLTNGSGGILDDLMVGNGGDHLTLVVNAARKAEDLAHIRAHLSSDTVVEELTDRALLALQGPAAVNIMGKLAPESIVLRFMAFAPMNIGAIPCVVARSGYTGEDGFEISVAADQAESLARMLLAEPGVAPAGLGARDSLRLEAGLCLYGADIDTTTTPVEAGLAWTISRRRRQEAGFPGAETILAQLAKGSAKTRVGIQALDKTPARAHTAITDADGRTVGEITSGGFGPSVGGPVAMGYVDTRCAASGTKLMAVVRGTPREARVVDLPFVPHRYCLR